LEPQARAAAPNEHCTEAARRECACVTGTTEHDHVVVACFTDCGLDLVAGKLLPRGRHAFRGRSVLEIDIPSLAELIEGLTGALYACLVFLLQIGNELGRVHRRSDLERRRSGNQLAGTGLT
jgi:hypothetical protein